jgi:hypothetical protein
MAKNKEVEEKVFTQLAFGIVKTPGAETYEVVEVGFDMESKEATVKTTTVCRNKFEAFDLFKLKTYKHGGIVP